MREELILEKLQDIFHDIFGDETIIIDKSTSTSDIEGWDSLTHISILEAIQEEFDTKFSLDEMINLTDVGKILEAIIRRENVTG